MVANGAWRGRSSTLSRLVGPGHADTSRTGRSEPSAPRSAARRPVHDRPVERCRCSSRPCASVRQRGVGSDRTGLHRVRGAPGRASENRENRLVGAEMCRIPLRRSAPVACRRRRTPATYPQLGGEGLWCGRRQDTACSYAAARQSRPLSLSLQRLQLGSQVGLAAGSAQKPQPVGSVEVTATDGSSVTIAWPPSRDDSVVGYGVYVNGAQVGTETPDHVKRWRDRDVALVHGSVACLWHGLHGWRGCVRSWRQPLVVDLDDGVDLGLSGRDSPLGTDRDAPGRHDGNLRDAGVVCLDRQRRRGRVRALRCPVCGSRPRATPARRSRTLPAERATWSRSTRPTRRATAPRASIRTSAPPPAPRPPTSRRRPRPWSRSRRPPRPAWLCLGRPRPTTSA